MKEQDLLDDVHVDEKDKRRMKRMRDIKDKKELYRKWKPSKKTRFQEEDFME